MIRSVSPLALVAGVAFLFSGYGTGDATPTCSAQPKGPSLELVYRLEAGEEEVTPQTREVAMEIVCKRLQAVGGKGGEVRAVGEDRIRVVLPHSSNAQQVADHIAIPGQLYFYDWEPNLIGPERRIGGHPGQAPPASALKKAKREWRAAGRDINRPVNVRLILAGAFANGYGAVKLASEQKPRKRCSTCSASTPRYYMFDRSAVHELIAGPVTDRADLRSIAGRHRRSGSVVLEVPVGTAIVSEQPTNSFGEPVAAAEPGWFALKDRPALSGEDIVDPRQERDELGLPNVTFEFTKEGQAAFKRVTRTIAWRGRVRADGRVGGRRAEELSGSFAGVFDNEMKVRPIVNFAENPNGIDGRVGAQIAGGFASAGEARDLATILRIGALPIKMVLIRREEASPRGQY